jgi:hypothetical protein
VTDGKTDKGRVRKRKWRTKKKSVPTELSIADATLNSLFVRRLFARYKAPGALYYYYFKDVPYFVTFN